VNKRWVIAPTEPALAKKLSRELRLPPVLAQVLINRGCRNAEAARAFLNPQLRQLRDPFELPDMATAVDRLQGAIENRERIVIYGDYDVDGVTASALLARVLHAAGASVETFLPHRMDEGYGLSKAGIARCLKQHKPDLLIAVDCGTGSVAEISDLKSRHVDVVVLDHHEPPEQLPDCPLVNPKLHYAITAFAAVGIGFKLAHALLKQDRKLAGQIDLRDHLDLVAIGTVADVVALTGENRVLVKAGLDRLPATQKLGLRALMDVADVPDVVTPYHIGFRIGPRLNAAGRLADARAALELLLTEDAGRAAELANLLDEQNARRQRIEEQIVEQALAMARQFERDRVLVLADDAWHVGVIGIVASRVVQEFYRPTVVIGTGGKGSCRSVTGFSIVEALSHCAPLLEKFGGHEMAAGLGVKAGNIDKLRRALNAHAGQALKDENLRPQVIVDATVRLDELDEEFFAQLARFEPCGPDNPTPVFAVRDASVRGSARVVGKGHLKFFVSDGESVVEAIWWGMGGVQLPAGPLDIAFAPELNEYGGVETVQLHVKDVRAPAAR
jgi:single-stranded-DNA-specific exonuclease